MSAILVSGCELEFWGVSVEWGDTGLLMCWLLTGEPANDLLNSFLRLPQISGAAAS